MTTGIKPYELNHEQWAKVAPLLPRKGWIVNQRKLPSADRD